MIFMFFNTLKYETGLSNVYKFGSCCLVDPHHINFIYHTVSAVCYEYHMVHINKLLAEFERYEC
jgi:hypothetical protein